MNEEKFNKLIRPVKQIDLRLRNIEFQDSNPCPSEIRGSVKQ
jgi:hypothetical protein